MGTKQETCAEKRGHHCPSSPNELHVVLRAQTLASHPKLRTTLMVRFRRTESDNFCANVVSINTLVRVQKFAGIVI
jgi:hypothetical protein